jgi:hypothetical protein
MVRRLSPDLVAMFVAALAFTLFGAVTGAFFFVVLCGSCLLLISIEVVATLRRRSPTG